jgi:hypothetical protein
MVDWDIIYENPSIFEIDKIVHIMLLNKFKSIL